MLLNRFATRIGRSKTRDIQKVYQRSSKPATCYIVNNTRPFSSATAEKDWYADKIHFDTLPELQMKACAQYAEKPLFGTRNGDKFDWVTFAEFGSDVKDFRKILASPPYSLKYGENLAIISNNRVEWAVCSYACASLGVPMVPMYEAQTEKDWKYIIEDSDSKVLVVATMRIYEILKEYIGTVGKVESIIVLDAEADAPYSYKGLMKSAASAPDAPVYEGLTRDDVNTIIYTSGTTGNPKGVELTHGNCHASITGVIDVFQDKILGRTHLAFLPWAHVYGMQSELNAGIWNGSHMALVPSREQIVECISIVKPEMIVSVPALFNRIYDGVQKNLRNESEGKQKLIKYAFNIARQRNELLEFGKSVPLFLELQFKLFDKIVFSKIRAKFGGKLISFAAGGAATTMPVLHFFEDMGIPILEGYGLTETSPIITCSGEGWDTRRLGTVGVPIRDVTVRIIDPNTLEELPSGVDGEVTCSGPNVMKQYRKNPAANEEVFYYIDGKRFFRTGDMGRMVEGKFLKITGRIKEQFKLANGKFVVPAPLEDMYGRSLYIAQTFIYGDNEKNTVCLIVPDWLEMSAWVRAEAASDASLEEFVAAAARMVPTVPMVMPSEEESAHAIKLFDHPKVLLLMQQEFEKVGKTVRSYERPSAFVPLAVPFSQENQMQTPKMSLRRNMILKNYMPVIEGLYSGTAGYSCGTVPNKSDE